MGFLNISKICALVHEYNIILSAKNRQNKLRVRRGPGGALSKRLIKLDRKAAITLIKRKDQLTRGNHQSRIGKTRWVCFEVQGRFGDRRQACGLDPKHPGISRQGNGKCRFTFARIQHGDQGASFTFRRNGLQVGNGMGHPMQIDSRTECRDQRRMIKAVK